MPARPRLNPLEEPTNAQIVEAIKVCAKEAVLMAITVMILGSIAIGILSGICGEMVPSLPPGLGGQTGLESQTGSAGALTHWWHAPTIAFHRHSFVMLWAVLFIAKMALRLARYSTNPWQRAVAARLLRVSHRVLRDWFKILIKNAFAAFIAVLVLQAIPRFSWTSLLWAALKDQIHPLFEAAAHLMSGRLLGLFQEWFSWYGDNQTKLSFWLLFSAAVCDDLGLPNYKTLACWAWRRIRKGIEQRRVASA